MGSAAARAAADIADLNIFTLVPLTDFQNTAAPHSGSALPRRASTTLFGRLTT